MNSKVLIIIGAVAVGVTIAAAITSNTASRKVEVSENQASEYILPTLNKRINDVAEILIEDKTTSITLTRKDSTWTLVNASGYPANFDNVRKLMIDVSNFTKLEEKTSNPASYSRLEVEDPSPTAEARSSRVTFRDGSGTTIESIILGKTHFAPGGGSQQMMFARRGGDKTSWLVKGSTTANTTTNYWWRTETFTIPSNRVNRVRIDHTDGEVVEILKENDSDINFKLLTLPEGRELAAESRPNEASNVYISLRFDTVKAAKDLKEPVMNGTNVYRTFDGLVVTAKNWTAENRQWATFAAEVDEAAIQSLNEKRTARFEEQKANAAEGETIPDPVLIKLEDIQAEAAKINSATDGWAYGLNSTVHERLLRRNQFFLKELTPEQAETQVGPPIELNDSPEDEAPTETATETPAPELPETTE